MNYRDDITFLRAVSIIAVISNHISHSFMPLGYMGVDVFFLISGFVISLALDNSYQGGGRSVW